jgi:hypothetical protein
VIFVAYYSYKQGTRSKGGLFTVLPRRGILGSSR